MWKVWKVWKALRPLLLRPRPPLRPLPPLKRRRSTSRARSIARGCRPCSPPSGGNSAPARIGVKLSSGEPGGNHYLKGDLIADLVHAVGGTIVECNTAYGGGRSSIAAHYQVAADHGFTAIADFQIMDEAGSLSLPVVGGLAPV